MADDTAGVTTDGTESRTSSDTGQDPSGGGSEGSGTSTGGASGAAVSAIPPTWLRHLDGLLSLAPPHIASLPNGDAAAFVTGGLHADEIAFAAGAEDGVVLHTPYVVPAVATLDGSTGAVESARLLAEIAPGAPQGISVQLASLDRAPNGDLLATGSFVGTTTFFPGTSDATSLAALQALNGDTFDRAEDPFFVRLDAQGNLVWLTRGRTPGPLSTTWFNSGVGIAALPGGDVVVSGQFALPGFILGDGTPGQTVLHGTQGSYLSRFDGSGAPQWAGRNTARIVWAGLTASPDGAVYGLLPGNATLFADSVAPVVVAPEPDMSSVTLARIDPAGELEWTATIAGESGGPFGLEVTASGSLVVHGNNVGEFLLRDSGGAETTEAFGTYRGWIAGIDEDGHTEWLRALGEGHTSSQPVLGGAGGVWVATRLAAPFDLELGGEVVPLPELGLDDDVVADLLVRVDAFGDLTAAHVLGSGIRPASLDWVDDSETGAFAIGGYHCAESPSVIDSDGTGLEPLPTGCESGSNDQLGWVAAFPL